MQCVLQILDTTIKKKPYARIGNRINGMNREKKKENESMSVCGHQVFRNLCIRCYLNCTGPMLCYAWTICGLFQLYVYLLNVCEPSVCGASDVTLLNVSRIDTVFHCSFSNVTDDWKRIINSPWKSCFASVSRATNLVHFKLYTSNYTLQISGTCWFLLKLVSFAFDIWLSTKFTGVLCASFTFAQQLPW